MVEPETLAIAPDLNDAVGGGRTAAILFDCDSCPAKAGGGRSRGDLDHPTVSGMVDIINEDGRIAAADDSLAASSLKRERMGLNVSQGRRPCTRSSRDHDCGSVSSDLIESCRDVSFIAGKCVDGLRAHAGSAKTAEEKRKH